MTIRMSCIKVVTLRTLFHSFVPTVLLLTAALTHDGHIMSFCHQAGMTYKRKNTRNQ